MVKTPDEVDPHIKEEMSELVIQLRGTAIKLVALGRLAEEDRDSLDSHGFDEEAIGEMDLIQLWMQWKNISDAEAIIRLAFHCNLITDVRRDQLLEKLEI